MIITLHKPLNQLKIGILGSRQHIFIDELKERNITFHNIEKIDEIDTSFDIIFGSGIYQLLKEPHLSYPAYGCIFFHETFLPEGKGNAPLQWSVLNHKTNLTVTAFKAVEAMDAGDYIYQHNIGLSDLDTLAHLENKRIQGIRECFAVILNEMEQGYLVFRPQSGKSTISPRRRPEDAELDVNQPLVRLWDQIRICDNERFPAFFRINGKKVILRYEIEKD